MPSLSFRLLCACLLLPLAALGQVTPAPGPLVPEPLEQAAPPANAPPSLPIFDTVFDGRAQQIPVEDPTNPMVVIETTRGNMLFELFPREAPLTVANFLGLADGTQPWVDSTTGLEMTQPYYDGLGFHRVVRNVLIQGGSPTGTDDGYPGYFVPDEINAASLGLDRMSVLDEQGVPNPVLGIRNREDFQETVLKPLYDSLGIDSSTQLQPRLGEVDQKVRELSVKQLYEMQGYHYSENLVSRSPVRGVIAMANAGPDRNGSQFFITLADTDWLVGRHTVFGKIRAGFEVLDAIGAARVDQQNRPQPEIVIVSIRILQAASATP
ncbi:MAG TPA: peptidylprolyl isomerase [Hyphomicrobiales bacterium]|nr:peptidylprolyl isomerase [Hyphomicrobiales bacterium]